MGGRSSFIRQSPEEPKVLQDIAVRWPLHNFPVLVHFSMLFLPRFPFPSKTQLLHMCPLKSTCPQLMLITATYQKFWTKLNLSEPSLCSRQSWEHHGWTRSWISAPSCSSVSSYLWRAYSRICAPTWQTYLCRGVSTICAPTFFY